MYCIHCGAKLEGRPKYCYHCGRPLDLASRPAVPQPPGALSPTGGAPPVVIRRPRRRYLPRWLVTTILVLIVVVLVCGGAVSAVYLSLGLHRTFQAARVVPARTILLVSLSPTLQHLPQLRYADNVRKGGAVLVALLGIAEELDLVGQELPLDLDLDVERDILPWIGREVSLGIVPPGVGAEDGEGGLVLVAATRNRHTSDAFLEQLRYQLEGQDYEFEETIYRGAEITEFGRRGEPPLAFTTVKHLVIAATSVDLLEEMIDAAEGDDKSALFEQRAFKDAVDSLPASRLGYAYFGSWSMLSEDIWEDLGPIEELPMARLLAMEKAIVALGLAEDGLCFDYARHYDLGALSSAQKDQLRQSASRHRLLDMTPRDAVLYISGQDLSSAVQSFTDTETWGDLENDIGIYQLDDLLSSLTGDYAWVAVADSSGLLASVVPMGVLFYIELEDRESVERILEDLFQEMDLQLDEDEIDRVPVWLAEDENAGITIGYGFVEDYVFVGTSRNMIRLAVEARDAPLADNPAFRKAVKPLPQDNRGYLYVDVRELVDTLYREMDDDDQENFDATIRPYIESILSISNAAQSMDRHGVVRGVLFVQTDIQ